LPGNPAGGLTAFYLGLLIGLMPDSPRETESPRLTQSTRRERAEREARLATALRDNLHRRKQQARDRAGADTADSDGRDVDGREAQDDKAEPSSRQNGTTDPSG